MPIARQQSKILVNRNRRKKPARPRRLHERRHDLLILNAATQIDIYLWMLAIMIAASILVAFVVLALARLNATAVVG